MSIVSPGSLLERAMRGYSGPVPAPMAGEFSHVYFLGPHPCLIRVISVDQR